MTAGLWLLLLAGALPPGGAGDPCRLLNRQEVGEAAGGRVAETKATRRNAGELEISACFYRAEQFQYSVSLEITRGAASSGHGARRHWEAVFHPSAEEEEEGEREQAAAVSKEKEREKESPPRPVEGVGDEAFWISNPASGALYVRKADAYIRISVGGAADEAVKLRRATELARKALKRL